MFSKVSILIKFFIIRSIVLFFSSVNCCSQTGKELDLFLNSGMWIEESELKFKLWFFLIELTKLVELLVAEGSLKSDNEFELAAELSLLIGLRSMILKFKSKFSRMFLNPLLMINRLIVLSS